MIAPVVFVVGASRLGGKAGECAAHYYLAVLAVDAAHLVQHILNGNAYGHIHEYLCFGSAMHLANYGYVLIYAGLLILYGLCHPEDGLAVYHVCMGRGGELCGLKENAQALAHYRALFAHGVNIGKEMNADIRLVGNGLLYGGDCLGVLALDGEDSLLGVGNFHAVLYAADGLFSLLFKLHDVVLEAGSALCRVYEYVAALKVCAQLYAGGEACAAHANYSGLLDHLQLAVALLYGDVLVRLLVVGLDHYGLVGYFLYRAVNGGEDVCAETGGSGYQCALFYLVAGLYYCRARRANMLLEQKFDFPHDALPFPF